MPCEEPQSWAARLVEHASQTRLLATAKLLHVLYRWSGSYKSCANRTSNSLHGPPMWRADFLIDQCTDRNISRTFNSTTVFETGPQRLRSAGRKSQNSAIPGRKQLQQQLQLQQQRPLLLPVAYTVSSDMQLQLSQGEKGFRTRLRHGNGNMSLLQSVCMLPPRSYVHLLLVLMFTADWSDQV